MRIGVDIDGTLYPWTLSVNKAVEEKFGIKDLVEHTHWDYLHELLTPKQWAWVWSAEGVLPVFGRDDFFPGCIEAVNALAKKHEVHFVTHRNPSLTSEITAAWVARYFKGYAGLHVLSSKVPKTSLGHWDAFIDDKPDTIEEFLNNTESLVFIPSRPWNEDVVGGFRFTDWSAVMHALSVVRS